MEELYENAFALILSAGNSKSNSMLAIKSAREGHFDEADAYLELAQTELVNAHQIQTELIQKEAKGHKIELNLIMVHAQDHLTMALSVLENAKEFRNLYEEIYELKK